MLITAYGKQGDFNSAERVMSYMNKKNYPPSVISHTALMEAYGRGKRYKNAEAIFRRMQSSGPEPSALTYQIILNTFVEVFRANFAVLVLLLAFFHGMTQGCVYCRATNLRKQRKFLRPY